MLDQRFKSLLRGLIYPVQFDETPTDGIDRVLGQVVFAKAMNAAPAEYLAAVQAGLASDEQLSRLIPQKHPEPVIRTYLSEIQKRLETA